MDIPAIEALLNLHCSPTRRSPSDVKLEIPGGTPLFLSRLPSSKILSTPNRPSPALNKFSRHGSVGSQDDNSEANSPTSLDTSFGYRGNKYRSTDTNRHPERTRPYIRTMKQDAKMKMAPRKSLINLYDSMSQPIRLEKKKTCEQGSQTDEIENMAGIISNLYAEIRALENQLSEKPRNTLYPTVRGPDPDVSTDVLKIQQYNNQNNECNEKSNKSIQNSSDMPANSTPIDMDASDEEWKPENFRPRGQTVHKMPKPECTEMVHIGKGYASVPAKLLQEIECGTSYSYATRKLLSAVFSSRVLATHSLSGKQSPAYPGIPAKKQLEPKLVNDVVQTVVERCGVSESLVRNIITIKCSQEAKELREKNKKKQQSLKLDQDQGNVLSSPHDIGESSDDAC